ncbi:MAG: 30S ribosomal protein S6 [Candidatus Hydrogenedentes bacterium]|nr:30S ribosomal protein S6 [Candidatus Hydrogenedentota bacterium]
MSLRTYEALYICSPELEEGDIQTVDQKYQTLVQENGGTIVRSEIWGKRKLAYMVKKHAEGVYMLLRFQAQPEFVKRLEGIFKIDESVIRFLVVYFDEHTLRIEEEQERRRREEVLSNASKRDYNDDSDVGPGGDYDDE